MEERRVQEQYFFDEATVDHLARFISSFDYPCCLCTPLVGQALVRRGIKVRILDVDERFADVPGFRPYDLARPTWMGEKYGIIVGDPPFFGLSLNQIYRALRILSLYDSSQPTLLAYLERRASRLLSCLCPYHLRPTGYHPTYRSVQAQGRNAIELYGNLGRQRHQDLCQDINHPIERASHERSPQEG